MKYKNPPISNSLFAVTIVGYIKHAFYTVVVKCQKIFDNIKTLCFFSSCLSRQAIGFNLILCITWLGLVTKDNFSLFKVQINRSNSIKMDSTGTNMCKAVEIEGVAVKATFESRVCVGGNLINVIKTFISIHLWLTAVIHE